MSPDSGYNGIVSYVCAMPGELSEFNLYFLNEKLVRIDAKVNSELASDAEKKIFEHFGNQEIPQDTNKLKLDLGGFPSKGEKLTAVLKSAFGDDYTCGTCSVSRLNQKSNSDMVYLSRESGKVSMISIYNAQLTDQILAAQNAVQRQEQDRQMASDQKRNQF